MPAPASRRVAAATRAPARPAAAERAAVPAPPGRQFLNLADRPGHLGDDDAHPLDLADVACGSAVGKGAKHLLDRKLALHPVAEHVVIARALDRDGPEGFAHHRAERIAPG